MPSLIRLLSLAPALLAAVHAQGVIQSAQGTKGSPASLPLQVDLLAADANVINPSEIAQNVVNECGRTLLAGNIDIGTVTEAQLLNKTVTSVTKGGNVDVTINQLDENGKGPYSCDMDLTSNADGTSGQTNLTVKETDAGGVTKLSVTMPKDMACVGGSSLALLFMNITNGMQLPQATSAQSAASTPPQTGPLVHLSPSPFFFL